MEKLIANLESAAVSRAAMGLRMQGAVFTAVGAGIVGIAYKIYQRKKQVNFESQDTARAELRKAVDAEEQEQDDDADGQ